MLEFSIEGFELEWGHVFEGKVFEWRWAETWDKIIITTTKEDLKETEEEF